MKIEVLNILLEFIGSDYRIIESLNLPSGQREVYKAENIINGEGIFILKTSKNNSPDAISRLQRELNILKELDSNYFPDFFEGGFISQDIIDLFFDSEFFYDLPEESMKLLIKEPIVPLFYSIESYIEHVEFDHIQTILKDEVKLVDFMIEIFSAMKLVWDNKITHRDLKPGNVLVTCELKPIIIDFGAAKSFRDGTSDITAPYGIAPRTIPFASPEQIMNIKREIGYKSDQFALGVYFFYLLTSKLPYGNVQVIGMVKLIDNFRNKKLDDISNYNPNISEKTINFINRLLEVDTHRRFRRAETILEELIKIKETI